MRDLATFLQPPPLGTYPIPSSPTPVTHHDDKTLGIHHRSGDVRRLWSGRSRDASASCFRKCLHFVHCCGWSRSLNGRFVHSTHTLLPCQNLKKINSLSLSRTLIDCGKCGQSKPTGPESAWTVSNALEAAGGTVLVFETAFFMGVVVGEKINE
jgi:hypothetical protein